MTPETAATLKRFEESYYKIASLTEELEQEKRAFRVIADNDLPETMDSEDLKEAITESGLQVKLSEAVFVSVNEKNREEAIRWLNKNGYGKLLKYEYTIQFGMQEDKEAELFGKKIEELFPEQNIRVVADTSCAKLEIDVKKMIAEEFPDKRFELKRTIHGGTLKSFVKKKLKAGEPLPEMFGTYVPKSAQVTKAKAEKDGIHGVAGGNESMEDILGNG